MASKFDFVIVGGGVAGLLLASRLTEDPKVQVLVLEAGEDLLEDPRINLPILWTQLQQTSADWNFKTVPQTAMGGRELSIVQGRLLGGSGALNGMNFVTSSRQNLDAWEALGNEGWNYSTLSQAIRKVCSLATSTGTEGGGPVQINVPDDDTKWTQVWEKTINALGYPTNSDPLSGDIRGAISYPDAIDPVTKTRSFIGNTYFKEARARPNLTVWTQVLVNKVVLKKEPNGEVVAMGIQYTKDGETKTVEADKEVIVSAGTFGSCKVLEYSGIGDSALLQSLCIETMVDNPHVGENLQNHPCVTIQFETTDHGDDPDFWTMDKISRQDPAALAAAMEAYTKQSGPFSKTNINVMAMLPFPNIDSDEGKKALSQVLESPPFNADFAPSETKTTPAYASAHKSFVHSSLLKATSAQYISFPGWGAYNPTTGLAEFAPPANLDPAASHMTIAIILNHPLSRGSIHITSPSTSSSSSNPDLIVDPAQNTHPLDAEILSHHVDYLVNTLSKTAPLGNHLKGPSPGAAPSEPGLEATRRWVTDNSILCQHFTGTCSMMPREIGGVVDPRLRVYGVKGLRVCDASVMPLTTRGNTMATTYAVAQRGAEIIKGDYGYM